MDHHEISFNDWSRKLDDHSWNSTTSYTFPSGDDDTLFFTTTVISDNSLSTVGNNSSSATMSTFIVLETIYEEAETESISSTTDNTCSASCSSSTSTDDVQSVIHVSPDSDNESERDIEIPKKRIKRINSLDTDNNGELSRSSSLLQFESLEKAIKNGDDENLDVIFRTSASEQPFSSSSTSQPPSFSNIHFDTDSGSNSETTSTLSDSSSDQENEYYLDKNKYNLSKLKSYRSFDSLLHVLPGSKLNNEEGEQEFLLEVSSAPVVVKTLFNQSPIFEEEGDDDDEEQQQLEQHPLPSSRLNINSRNNIEEEKKECFTSNNSNSIGLSNAQATTITSDQRLNLLAGNNFNDFIQISTFKQNSNEHINFIPVSENIKFTTFNSQSKSNENLFDFSSTTPSSFTTNSSEILNNFTFSTFKGSDNLISTEPDDVFNIKLPPSIDFNSSSGGIENQLFIPYSDTINFYGSDDNDKYLISETHTLEYKSEPNLLSTARMEPTEITEEVIHKIQVGGIPIHQQQQQQLQHHQQQLTPLSSKQKSSRFGTFFNRFSFRKNKNKSTESLDKNTEDAINSVTKCAEELSNLDKEPSSKSRLLGIVGRKKLISNNAQVQLSGAGAAQAPSSVVIIQDKNDIDYFAASGGSAAQQPFTVVTPTSKNDQQKKSSSLVNLGNMNIVEINDDYGEKHLSSLHPTTATNSSGNTAVDNRAKSMEFLLDEQNKATVLPPENELRKVTERQLSEHELRVQRSLQRLNVPDWYKNSHVTNQSNFSWKRTGSGTKTGGWQGLNSKTTSLSSLQQSPNLRGKRENASPVVSPSPQERLSFSYAPFSRWSTSRLNSGPNSTSTSPSGSTRSSFHYRQPYLGWRSQEKLLGSTPTHYRGPAERLAANLLSKPPLPPTVNVLPPPSNQNKHDIDEVQSSIKEVTSAIVHYVKEKNLSPATNSRPRDLSRSPSPRGSKTRVWVESSFVGTRPIDSPQTPQITGENTSTPATNANGHFTGTFIDIHNSHDKTFEDEEEKLSFKLKSCDNNVNEQIVTEKPKLEDELSQLLENFGRPSPSSNNATIEDVLDSLLGLPTTSRSPSPVVSPRGSQTFLNNAAAEPELAHEIQRRHSITSSTVSQQDKIKIRRRVSFELKLAQTNSTNDVIKCRYSKCGKIATLTEARSTFKTCHNCNSHIYCSRECRRIHWEKSHRKTCLNSRIGALCRKVITACKEHTASLEVLSKLARTGYLGNGRGCVKVLFNSTDLAERFVNAVSSAAINESLLPGEPCYILWSGLLPTEMGNDIYKELLRLCKSYNPDSRLVLYVAISVVSEVPGTTGTVKWERNLITRCAKLRLHKSSIPCTRDIENPETLILTPITPASKEIIVTNIQRQLRQRGISLRKNFPEVYKKLVAFVENNESFTPVTIYPKDIVTGKNFMCVILAEHQQDQEALISDKIKTIDIGIPIE